MRFRLHSRAVAVVVAVCLTAGVARGQTVTQSFTLQPGWNAIYLEVRPTDNSTATIFSNLPVASVWTRAERLSAVDFIQDASEESFNRAGWLGWFRPSRPEAFLGNLFAVQANRAYLIKTTNSTLVTWNVSGRPSLRQPEWVADAYNLRGLPVDGSSPPTFLNFFRTSRAHYDSATGQLQTIYRLDASGQWTQLAATDTIRSGEAYWIFTKGASDFVAPLKASVELGDGLEYGLQLTELNLRVANTMSASLNALVQDLGLAGPTTLSYYQFDPALGAQWLNLPTPLAVNVPPGSEVRLRVAVRREDIAGASYNSVLQIRDGAGTRFLVPVTAETVNAPAGVLARQGRPAPHAPIDEAKARAGLWVGTGTINAVAEAHSAQPTTPTPTKSEFNLRLLVHVDSNGQARLLKDVIQMWRDGTYTNDASGNLLVDKPGRYVLLTDDTLISRFQGAAVRDGESVGRRLSSVGRGHLRGRPPALRGLPGPRRSRIWRGPRWRRPVDRFQWHQRVRTWRQLFALTAGLLELHFIRDARGTGLCQSPAAVVCERNAGAHGPDQHENVCPCHAINA